MTELEVDITRPWTRIELKTELTKLDLDAWAYLVIEHEDTAEVYALASADCIHVPEGTDAFMVARTPAVVFSRLSALVGAT